MKKSNLISGKIIMIIIIIITTTTTKMAKQAVQRSNIISILGKCLKLNWMCPWETWSTWSCSEQDQTQTDKLQRSLPTETDKLQRSLPAEMTLFPKTLSKDLIQSTVFFNWCIAHSFSTSSTDHAVFRTKRVSRWYVMNIIPLFASYQCHNLIHVYFL